MSNETACQDCGLREQHTVRQCVERLKAQLAEARLEEARWWRNNFPPHSLDFDGHDKAYIRIAELERISLQAAETKTSLGLER